MREGGPLSLPRARNGVRDEGDWTSPEDCLVGTDLIVDGGVFLHPISEYGN